MKELQELSVYLSAKEEWDIDRIQSETQRNGIILTRGDIEVIKVEGENIIEAYGRVAFENTVLETLVIRFSDSPFIQSWEYKDTILEIYEIFHYIKKEVNDEIMDDEIIHFLYEAFNGLCQGSLAYLAEKEAYDFIQNSKNGTGGDMNARGDD